jgi:hypothetical protein
VRKVANLHPSRLIRYHLHPSIEDRQRGLGMQSVQQLVYARMRSCRFAHDQSELAVISAH